MGQAKELMFERQQEEANKKLAKKLGITYDEFIQLEYEIDTEESNDGLIYNYIITFSDNSPKEIIEKIIGIDDNNMVWRPPWEFENENSYDEEFDSIISNKDYYQSFNNEIDAIRKLNEIQLDNQHLNSIHKRQIYISVIGAIETFLAETFINLTIENEKYFENFIENYPVFKRRKFELNQFYKVKDTIKGIAKKEMLDVIYHRLDIVSKMYISTFNIEFPNYSELSKSIKIRHDLVHRNGKTKEGGTITIDAKLVENLINNALTFSKEITGKLNITNSNMFNN